MDIKNKFERITPFIIGFDLILYPKDKRFIYRFETIMERIRDSYGANRYGMREVLHKADDGFTSYYVTKLSCFLNYGNVTRDGGFEEMVIKITGINPYNLFGENSILHGADGSNPDKLAGPYIALMDFLKFIGYYGHASDDEEYLQTRDTWGIKNVVCVQDFYVKGHPEFYLELFRKVSSECKKKPITNMRGLGWKDEWSDEITSVDFFHLKKWAKKYNSFLMDNNLEPLKKKELKVCENRMRFAVTLKTPKIISQYAYNPDPNILLELLSGEYCYQAVLVDYAESLFGSEKMVFSTYNQVPNSMKDDCVFIDGDDFDKTFTKLFYSYKTNKSNMNQYIIG